MVPLVPMSTALEADFLPPGYRSGETDREREGGGRERGVSGGREGREREREREREPSPLAYNQVTVQ